MEDESMDTICIYGLRGTIIQRPSRYCAVIAIREKDEMVEFALMRQCAWRPCSTDA
jgi:hypothetical protein